jgi:hypothetical protein
VFGKIEVMGYTNKEEETISIKTEKGKYLKLNCHSFPNTFPSALEHHHAIDRTEFFVSQIQETGNIIFSAFIFESLGSYFILAMPSFPIVFILSV